MPHKQKTKRFSVGSVLGAETLLCKAITTSDKTKISAALAELLVASRMHRLDEIMSGKQLCIQYHFNDACPACRTTGLIARSCNVANGRPRIRPLETRDPVFTCDLTCPAIRSASKGSTRLPEYLLDPKMGQTIESLYVLTTDTPDTSY